jgi:hypothetical protein
MTAQIGEKLFYQGKEYGMASEPQVISPELKNYEINFIGNCTACWRGYFGTWEVTDDKLFLKEISGVADVTDMTKYKEGKHQLKKLLKQGEITSKQHAKLLEKLRAEVTEQKVIDIQFLYQTSEPVFADWFTGVIRVPMGEMLQYVHMDYFSVFGEDMFLEFIKGILIKTQVVNNERHKNTANQKKGLE